MIIWLIAGMQMPAVFFYIKGIRRSDKDMRRRAGAAAVVLSSVCMGALMFSLRLSDSRLMELLISCEESSKDLMAEVEGTVTVREDRNSGIWCRIEDADVKTKYGGVRHQGVICIIKGDVLNEQEIKPGSQICIKGKLERFPEADNPGTFDKRQYYHNLGYDFCIYSEGCEISQGYGPEIRQKMYDIRKLFGNIIDHMCTDRYSGIYKALLLGDRQGVDHEQRQQYQEMGIAHILSVSGLHISIIGMAVYELIRRMSGSYGIGGAAGTVVIALYGILTGNAVSTVRAAVMYYVQLAGNYRGRIYDSSSAAGAALFVILSGNPLAVYLPSTQLSFAAVAGMGIVSDIFTGFLPAENKKAVRMIRTAGLQITMLPVVLYYYYTYPLYSIIINILVIPLSVILLVFPCLGILMFPLSLKLSSLAFRTADAVINYYDHICTVFSRLPGALYCSGRPPLYRIAVYSALLFLIGIYAAVRKRNRNLLIHGSGVAVRTLICVLSAYSYLVFGILWLKADRYQNMRITMLDAGQGECIVLEMPDKNVIMSDCGSTENTEMAEYTVEPFFQEKGIDCIDYVLVSHGDSDHVSGLLQLLQRGKIRVKNIVIPKGDRDEEFHELLFLAGMQKINVIRSGSGDILNGSEYGIEILNPGTGVFTGNNDASLVYRLTYGDFSMLFTGDISSETEKDLPLYGSVSVLKTAHHGSRFSTSYEFAEKVSPMAALISYGRNNYGHPSEEVIERLEKTGSTVFETKKSGAVIIETDGKKMQISAYRDSNISVDRQLSSDRQVENISKP